MNLIDDLLRTFRNDVPPATPTMVDDVIARLHKTPHGARRPPLRRLTLAAAGTVAVFAAGFAGFRIFDRATAPAISRPTPSWGATVTIGVKPDPGTRNGGDAGQVAELFRELWRREERIGLTANPHDGALTVTVPEARPDDLHQITNTFNAGVIDLSLPHRSFATVDALASWLAQQPGRPGTVWRRLKPQAELGNRTEVLQPSEEIVDGSSRRLVKPDELFIPFGMRIATVLISGEVSYVVIDPKQVLASTADAKVGWLDPATSLHKLMIVGDRAQTVRDALNAGHRVALLTGNPDVPSSGGGFEWGGAISAVEDDGTFVVAPSNVEIVKRRGTTTMSGNLFSGTPTGIDINGTLVDGGVSVFVEPPARVGEPAPSSQVRAIEGTPRMTIGTTPNIRRLFTARIDGQLKDLLGMTTPGGGQGYVVMDRRTGRVLPQVDNRQTWSQNLPRDCRLDPGRLLQACNMGFATDGVASPATWRTVLFGRVRGTVRSIRIVGAVRPVPVVVGEDWWISGEVVVAAPGTHVVLEGRDNNGAVVVRTRVDVPISPG